jgi:glycosyltransferase involved in cell wall biosynthesis
MTASASAPEVSIVIPTRDRHDWLPRTLAGALAQKAVQAEVILVDDGSREPVQPRLTAVASETVRVERHQRPLGVSTARNTGIANARGDWIAFLDDDDLWAPDKLATLLRAAKQASAEFAFSGGYYVDAEGDIVAMETPPDEEEDLHSMLLSRNITFCCSNVIASAPLIRAVGGFDPAFSHVADWDFAVRLSAAGEGIVVNEKLVACTLHEMNMHLDEAALLAEIRRFDAKHAAARTALGVSPDRIAWLRWRVTARRRAGERRGAALAYLELAGRCGDPVALTRGLAMGLGGERAMRLGQRVATRVRRGGEMPRPAWLERAAHPAADALGEIWR